MATESHALSPDFKTPTGTPVRTQRKDITTIPPEISITVVPVAEKEKENAIPKLEEEAEDPKQAGGTKNDSSCLDLKPAAVEVFPSDEDNSNNPKYVHQDHSFSSDEDASSEQQPAFLVPETVPPPPPVELVPNLVAAAAAAESSNKEEEGKESEEEATAPEAEQVPEGALVLSGDEEDDDGFVLIGDDALLSDNNLSGSYDFIRVNQSNKNTRR